METVDFTFRGVPRRYPDLVQQRAVLVPWVGHEIKETLGDDDAVIEQVRRLIARWRERIFVLAKAGWPGMAGEGDKTALDLTYAANCQPTFAMTVERTRSCRRREVCPFCHARQVLETWESIDHAFFADQVATKREAAEGGEPLRFRRSSWDLIERKLTCETARLRDGQPALALLLAFFRNTRAKRMGKAAKMPGFRGSYETLFVRMTAEGRWLAEVRMIFMVLGGFAIPEDWVKADRVDGYGATFTHLAKRYEKPKRVDVLNAVARTCRYPTFLLKGEPGAVVEYLRARKGDGPRVPKLSESYGEFRNKSARRRSSSS